MLIYTGRVKVGGSTRIINAVIMKWNKKKQKAAYLKEVDQKEL
jgi:hypothetical protein